MEPEFMTRVRGDERMEAERGVMEIQVEQASHLVPKVWCVEILCLIGPLNYTRFYTYHSVIT